MKFKQLTKKIFYEASESTPADDLEHFAECYETVPRDDLTSCMDKWKMVYSFYGSNEMFAQFRQGLAKRQPDS